MKVVIVEDEKLSAEHLSLVLQKIDISIEVIAHFDTIKATVNAFIDGLTADLLFLDIHLADGNSFEIFSKIHIELPIIFTTAYDHYAIQAFKQNSIDYLLKPIALPDLKFAIEKFKKQQQKTDSKLIENLTQAYHQLNKTYKSRFMVKLGQHIGAIQTIDIHHFVTQDSISFIVTAKGDRYPVDYTLDQLESLLEPKSFFRINRKIIINIQAIEKVNAYFNGRFAIASKFLDGDVRIVSRDRVNDFKIWLDN